MRIIWLVYKVKTLFKVKDKSLHQAYKIYKEVCTCGEIYIGETIRNVEVCWDEHNNPMNKSNPSKHTKDLIGQCLPMLQRTCLKEKS